MQSKKIIHPSIVTDPQLLAFSDQIKAPAFVASMLSKIGIQDTESARKFFVPTEDLAHSPSLMNGMEEALAILLDLKDKQSKIVVHGDYDVDGISGTSLLTLALREAGFAHVDSFLPSRFIQGYGLCIETIETFAKQGYDWIITVDTGITAVEEIARAKALGMGVIVCDHHQEGPELPLADVILNPQCKACSYPNPFLSGVGVAYKLMQHLFEALSLDTITDYLDLFCLGTLADMMPLDGENRLLVKQGLRSLPNSQRPGIQALFTEARIEPENVRSQDILFRMTPMINAVGRMGDPSKALDLLCSQTPKEARKHLQALKNANVKRRKLEQTISESATEMVENSEEFLNAPVLLLADKGWHQGVIGIVAARLMEKYTKPVAVLSIENGIGKASARSIPGFNWHKALEEAQDLLPRWGGHAFAAGFSVAEEDIPELRRRIVTTANRIEYAPKVEKSYESDYQIKFQDLNDDTMLWLQRFEPFGPKNESPLFSSKGVAIGSECRIVGGSHLKLKLKQNDVELDAIAFGQGDLLEDLNSKAGTLSIAFIPSWNYFRGQRTVQIQVKAIAFEDDL